MHILICSVLLKRVNKEPTHLYLGVPAHKGAQFSALCTQAQSTETQGGKIGDKHSEALTVRVGSHRSEAVYSYFMCMTEAAGQMRQYIQLLYVHD